MHPLLSISAVGSNVPRLSVHRDAVGKRVRIRLDGVWHNATVTSYSQRAQQHGVRCDGYATPIGSGGSSLMMALDTDNVQLLEEEADAPKRKRTRLPESSRQGPDAKASKRKPWRPSKPAALEAQEPERNMCVIHSALFVHAQFLRSGGHVLQSGYTQLSI